MLPIEIMAHINDYTQNSELKFLNKKTYNYVKQEEFGKKWQNIYLNRMRHLGLSNYVLSSDDNFVYNWKQEFVRISEYKYWNQIIKFIENYEKYLPHDTESLDIEISFDIPKEFYNICHFSKNYKNFNLHIKNSLLNFNKKSIPTELIYFENLEDFIMNANKLKTFPEFLIKMKNIKNINLQTKNKKIKYIPRSIIQNHNICITVNNVRFYHGYVHDVNLQNSGIQINRIIDKFSHGSDIKLSKIIKIHSKKFRVKTIMNTCSKILLYFLISGSYIIVSMIFGSYTRASLLFVSIGSLFGLFMILVFNIMFY